MSFKYPKQWKHWLSRLNLKIATPTRESWTKAVIKGRGRHWRINVHGEIQAGDLYEVFDRWANSTCATLGGQTFKTFEEFKQYIYALELMADMEISLSIGDQIIDTVCIDRVYMLHSWVTVKHCVHDNLQLQIIANASQPDHTRYVTRNIDVVAYADKQYWKDLENWIRGWVVGGCEKDLQKLVNISNTRAKLERDSIRYYEKDPIEFKRSTL